MPRSRLNLADGSEYILYNYRGVFKYHSPVYIKGAVLKDLK